MQFHARIVVQVSYQDPNAHHAFAARFIRSVLRWWSSTVSDIAFQSLEVTATNVRWCVAEWERGTSTWQLLGITDLVLRIGCRQGILSPDRCATCCTCALWSAVRAPTFLRCSRLSREGCCSCFPIFILRLSARRRTLSIKVSPWT